MLKILYWLILIASILLGIGAIGAMIDLLKQGDISTAAVEPIFIIPAVLLIVKKRAIYRWINRKSETSRVPVNNKVSNKSDDTDNSEINSTDSADHSKMEVIKNSDDDAVDVSRHPRISNYSARRVIRIRSSRIRYINFTFRTLFIILVFLDRAIGEASGHPKKDKKGNARNSMKRPSAITLLTPWVLELNMVKSVIHFKKRNWYLIGFDKQDFKYKQIRDIHVNEHIFTADVHIRFYAGYFAGKVSAYYFSKRQAAMFRNTLLPLIENPDS